MRAAAEERNALAPAIDAAAVRLHAAGIPAARLDAELLMAEAAGASRAAILAGAGHISADQLGRFEALVVRRARREPLAYITGRKEFYSLDFAVTRDVLIPRPETEQLIEAALGAIADARNARVLDFGTGSGAIAVALAHEAPTIRVVATDISRAALEIARRNAAAHRVADRMEFREADLFDPRDGGPPLGRFDAVLSNPPYIDDTALAALEPEVRDFEPRLATAAGTDGLAFYRRIADGASAHLTPGGHLIVEVGNRQAAAVARMFADAALRIVDVLNDLAGHPRVVHARRDGA